MEIDLHHGEPGAGIGLRVPTIVEFIQPGTLRPAVNEEGHRIFAAGFKGKRLDEVAVHRLAVPAREGKFFEVTEANALQPRGIELGEALLGSAPRPGTDLPGDFEGLANDHRH